MSDVQILPPDYSDWVLRNKKKTMTVEKDNHTTVPYEARKFEAV